MNEIVYIFGKDTWPYTTAAREDYAKRNIEVDYVNVKEDADGLRRMLEYTGGRRDVPVIVENDTVTTGFGGTW